jgi:hypothetical protein
LRELAQLLLQSLGSRAQKQDLRGQRSYCGADDKAANALLERGSDHAEQDRQAPGCPL